MAKEKIRRKNMHGTCIIMEKPRIINHAWPKKNNEENTCMTKENSKKIFDWVHDVVMMSYTQGRKVVKDFEIF